MNRDTVIDVTFTLDTSIYASGDVLSDTVAITRSALREGDSVVLDSLTIIDEDDQKQPLTAVFLDTNNSLGTKNSAPNISDANARKVLGHVSVVVGDYVDLGGVSVACVRNLGLVLKCDPATTSLYVALISGGTGTYTVNGLKGKIGIRR